MKTTNRGLQELQRNLSMVSGLKGVKFAFAVAKNSAKIKSELSEVQEVINKIEGLKEYDTERNKINADYAKLSFDNNKPTKEETEARDKSVEELNTKYEKSLNDWKDVMDLEIEFDAHLIKQVDLPEDITGAQLEGILTLVENEQ